MWLGEYVNIRDVSGLCKKNRQIAEEKIRPDSVGVRQMEETLLQIWKI